MWDRQKWCSVQGSSGWAWSSSQSPLWSLTWPTKCESSLRSLRSLSIQYTSNTENSSRISRISWRKTCLSFCVDFWESLAFPLCEYSVVNIWCCPRLTSACSRFKVSGAICKARHLIWRCFQRFHDVKAPVNFTEWRGCVSRLWWMRCRSSRLYPKTQEQWCMERGTDTRHFTTRVFGPWF